MERTLKLKPTNSRTLWDRGKLYASLGEHEKAIEDYTEAIRLDPDSIEVFELRTESYQSTGKTDSAEADIALAARKKGTCHQYGEYLEVARKFYYEQSGTH
ncbi:MAG: tetratricopeptide repeat protein [Caldilineaceae bacterium]|nr:tetratricopeptide repeat protein [Caldilineaceae bacterium]